MKVLTDKTKGLLALICLALALAPSTQGASITFNSDVDITSNLMVSGTALVTNFTGDNFNFSQNASSPYGSGSGAFLGTSATSDSGFGIGGGWIIGSGGSSEGNGGSLSIQGAGFGGTSTLGGSIVLDSGSASGGPNGANLTLFGGNLIGSGGTVSISAGDNPGNGTGANVLLAGGNTNGGDVFIQAGVATTDGNQPGKVVIAGGGTITIQSSMTNDDVLTSITLSANNGIYALNNLYATNVVVTGTLAILPQGDLSMGSFTNGPPRP